MTNKRGKPLLIIEDDKGLQRQMRWAFRGIFGYEVHLASNRAEGMAIFQRVRPGVVLLDLGLPPNPGQPTEGIAMLQGILSSAPETKVVIVTGDNERSHAVETIKLGAYDFYQKPVEPDILGFIVGRAYHVYELEVENQRLQSWSSRWLLDGIAASSPQMLEVCQMVERVAPIDVTVLLLGASGTGKERFAKAIHKLSPRHKEKMITINCAAIPDNLIESELFGYEKGAFTGATAQKIGKLERANGGTLFLDEIGDLPLELQAKLLRFLQERLIERVGGSDEIAIDTRIICATHKDLEGMVKDGNFREDLYYRIKDVTLHIPALKDREGDAILLAQVFLDRFSKELNYFNRGLTRDAIRAIESYTWPGNVRELESKIKRALILSKNGQITASDLELEDVDSEPLPLNLKRAREEAERRALLRAMAQTNNNITDSAMLLGVARPTVYKLLDKYHLTSPQLVEKRG